MGRRLIMPSSGGRGRVAAGGAGEGEQGAAAAAAATHRRRTMMLSSPAVRRDPPRRPMAQQLQRHSTRCRRHRLLRLPAWAPSHQPQAPASPGGAGAPPAADVRPEKRRPPPVAAAVAPPLPAAQRRPAQPSRRAAARPAARTKRAPRQLPPAESHWSWLQRRSGRRPLLGSWRPPLPARRRLRRGSKTCEGLPGCAQQLPQRCVCCSLVNRLWWLGIVALLRQGMQTSCVLRL